MNESERHTDPLFPKNEIKFASFWSRFGATVLDGLIVTVIVLPITYYNVISWKVPYLFILTSLFQIVYKPYMEYRYGATLGKMAAGIIVLGHEFQRVSFNEEMRRVSFYLVPSALQFIMTVHFYFTPAFTTTKVYNDFNQEMMTSNPATIILGGIVFFLLVADSITFFTNFQRRALHDIYAGTYVVDKY